MKFLSQLPSEKLNNKRALVRVDFNVTLSKNGKILDDFRIKACLPTIQYLIKNRAKVILISHLAKPQLTLGKKGDGKASLQGIGKYLSRLLDKKNLFIPDCRGPKVEEAVMALRPGQVVLLENLRFYSEEEKNDSGFARDLAELADVYVNDGFAVSHRAHASVVGVTEFLPSFSGFLLEKEIKNLDLALKNPPQPLAVVIGGAKVSTKLKLIDNFLKKGAEVMLGGVIANTVLGAKGLVLGKSLVEPEIIAELQRINLADSKLHLPVDVLVAKSDKNNAKAILRPVGRVGKEEIIFDIGPDTVELFSRIIHSVKMIIWNGPMGFFEKKAFASGTVAIARAIAKSHGFSIIGGGDTIIILNKLKLSNRFSFISTGGGAMLEYLAGDKLPGLEALEKNSSEI